MPKPLMRFAPLVIVMAATCAFAEDTPDIDARLIGYQKGAVTMEEPSTAGTWAMTAVLGLFAIGPLFLYARRTHLD